MARAIPLLAILETLTLGVMIDSFPSLVGIAVILLWTGAALSQPHRPRAADGAAPDGTVEAGRRTG